MYPRVEVIRMPGVNAEPRIQLQLREDEPEWSMTVDEAYAWVDKEALTVSPDCPAVGGCAFCMVLDALEGLR